MGGGLKMLSKNACDRVHLIVKLLAISSWKGALRFSEGGEEGGSKKKIVHWVGDAPLMPSHFGKTY